MKSVKLILLINLLVFGICSLFNFYGLHLENLFALYPVTSDNFSLYQLVTHLFIHGNVEHLFFNMLFLLICGPEVENYLGTKFFSFFILSGVFSSGLYCLGVGVPIIGASGAVFSVIALSIITTVSDKQFKNLISLKLRVIFFLSLIISELYFVIISQADNIGHWAHIFGVIFGILYYKKSLSENRET